MEEEMVGTFPTVKCSKKKIVEEEGDTKAHLLEIMVNFLTWHVILVVFWNFSSRCLEAPVCFRWLAHCLPPETTTMHGGWLSFVALDGALRDARYTN
jgi:hypothetical protein